MRDSIVSKYAFWSISSVTHDHWSIPRKSILAVDLFPSLFITYYWSAIPKVVSLEGRVLWLDLPDQLFRYFLPLQLPGDSGSKRQERVWTFTSIYVQRVKRRETWKCTYDQVLISNFFVWRSVTVFLMHTTLWARWVDRQTSFLHFERANIGFIYIFGFPGFQNWRHLHHWDPRQRSQCDTQVYISLFRCLGGTCFSKIEPEKIMCGELCFYHWWILFSMVVVKTLMVAAFGWIGHYFALDFKLSLSQWVSDWCHVIKVAAFGWLGHYFALVFVFRQLSDLIEAEPVSNVERWDYSFFVIFIMFFSMFFLFISFFYFIRLRYHGVLSAHIPEDLKTRWYIY